MEKNEKPDIIAYTVRTIDLKSILKYAQYYNPNKKALLEAFLQEMPLYSNYTYTSGGQAYNIFHSFKVEPEFLEFNPFKVSNTTFANHFKINGLKKECRIALSVKQCNFLKNEFNINFTCSAKKIDRACLDIQSWYITKEHLKQNKKNRCLPKCSIL